MRYVIYILIVWNLITFFMMGIDKFKSTHGKWRISEQTLLTSAFIMGAVGSLMGSMIFRHKTQKWKFRILLPAALLFNLSVIFLIWYYVL
jgi:Predicted membrane protein